jgi:hypothetical protein
LLGQPERYDTVCAYVRLVLTSAHCAGPAVYDKCDVCNGNSDTCLDCAGKINGATRYDVCDICGGNGSTCRDCLGVPNGEMSCVDVSVCTHALQTQARTVTSWCACKVH